MRNKIEKKEQKENKGGKRRASQREERIRGGGRGEESGGGGRGTITPIKENERTKVRTLINISISSTFTLLQLGIRKFHKDPNLLVGSDCTRHP